MLKLISIVLTVFLLIKPSFSIETEKKIKFHPPEAEAEKALDEILRIYYSDYKVFKIVKDEKLRDYKCIKKPYECKKFFTQNFSIMFRKKANDQCKNIDKEDICLAGDGMSCGNDYGNIDFGYHTYKTEKSIAYIMQTGSYMGKLEEEYRGRFKMKKEYGKWKIDDTECVGLYME